MPKYYVFSGQIKHIIDRPTDMVAITDTLEYYKGKGLMTGPKICVSERGWFEDICYETDPLLKDNHGK